MKPIKNNKGVALVTVVLIFLVLVILLAGVMFASVTNQKNAVVSKEHTSAYYVAESGLNLTIEKLDKFLEDNNYDDFLPTLYNTKMNALKAEILSYNGNSGSLTGINPQGTYTISILTPNTTSFTIRSTGVVNGLTRVIEGTFSFENKMVKMAKAVITKASITMANNALIDGPIASLMTGNATINVHGCDIGEVYVPDPDSPKVNEGESCNVVKAITSPVTFNSFTLPTYYSNSDLQQVNFSNGKYTFPPLNGKQGYYVSSLSSSNMTFDLGTSGTSDQITKLFVNNVSLNGVYDIGDITVTGNGKLMLFITINANNTTQNSGNPKYQFSWDGNVNIGQTDMTKFQLIIRKGSSFPNNTDPTFTIPNNNTFIGSVLADYVNIQFGNLVFKGFIGTLGTSFTTTSNATISGPMWVYAPNANVSLSSNSIVNGSIMANSVDITSGGSIIYKGFEGDLPFELNLPTFMGGELVPVGITFKFTNFREV